MTEPNFRALTALRRLRRIETDEARRQLGESLTHETALAERDTSIRRELDDARRMSGDFDREVLAAWYGRMVSVRARMAEAMHEAEARTTAARGVLAARRVAETAARDALEQQVKAQEDETARRDQLMLEDIARTLRR